MKFLRSKWLMVGTMGVAAVGLIGLGASASFTDSVKATQTITTGTLSMQIIATDCAGHADGVVSPDGKTATFKLGNSGSQINQVHCLDVLNNGTLPLSINSVKVKALGGGLDPAPLGDDVTWNINNNIGTVRQLESYSWYCANCGLNPGQLLGSFLFTFTGNLGNADEGQTINPTITLGAVEWDGSRSSSNTGIQAQS